MEIFSSKIEIINHFDNLINRIDIDIDTCLEKYNDQQILGELIKNSESDRKTFEEKEEIFYMYFNETLYTSIKQQTRINVWPESMKVIDYLNQVRMKTIEDLIKAEEETLQLYKHNSKKSELFYFQVNFSQSDKRYWPFNLFTFVTDFYVSHSDIVSLE